MIGLLNRRITIKTSTYVQDAGGGISADETDSYSMWAQVEERSGFPVISEGQQVWRYDYKIKVRYERTRIIRSNQTIEFDDKTLSVNSVGFQNEGKRKYAILRCSATDNNITSDDGS